MSKQLKVEFQAQGSYSEKVDKLVQQHKELEVAYSEVKVELEDKTKEIEGKTKVIEQIL